MNNKQDLLKLIEAALQGGAMEEEALAFMSKLKREDSEDICLAAHALIHFFDDCDIREMDEVYAQSQRDDLRRWVQVLAGAAQPDNSERS